MSYETWRPFCLGLIVLKACISLCNICSSIILAQETISTAHKHLKSQFISIITEGLRYVVRKMFPFDDVIMRFLCEKGEH